MGRTHTTSYQLWCRYDTGWVMMGFYTSISEARIAGSEKQCSDFYIIEVINWR